MPTSRDFLSLQSSIDGDVFTDDMHRLIYATDASAYREMPIAVVRPQNTKDIKKVIAFAGRYQTSIIPRTAGTSLAGQVVGGGMVVDVSKYMNRILEFNTVERWVRVEPGVVLDELNIEAAKYGLFFGPETSTSSRCMMGGMVGNNSCGAHSLIYGSTRDHLLSVNALLSDGSEVVFEAISLHAFQEKLHLKTLEGEVYRNISDLLGNAENQKEILAEYPAKSLERRNTGYAIDLLLDSEPFTEGGEKFNFCKLIAGSEGTLAFITEIKLNLVSLPPKEKALVCVHLNSVTEALYANLIALKFNPASIELMDKAIMDLTKENITQRKNRFFLKDDPGALLIVEFAENTRDKLQEKVLGLEKAMRVANYGFHFPVVKGADMKKVWELRKAGLGVMSNYPGDAKPVSVIEDTAIDPYLLPEFITEFQQLLEELELSVVYYAHIATGELHIKPVLNLKEKSDVEKFYQVALETAKLVKKYKGSLSGEHGDGRLRGEFIPLMIGEKNYSLLKTIKNTWDPYRIFNPGKITDTPSMKEMLRFTPGQKTREIETIFDFSKDHGLMRAIEKCNGSADCRKSEIMGGTMCPSYMATRNENATTRSRANILREYLTSSSKKNPFDHKEIYEVMDLCLSCKGCKSECPSNIDMARYKAEFLQHYYDEHGIPLRTRLIANITTINRMGAMASGIFNFFVSNSFFGKIIKSTLGFANQRTIPLLHKYTLLSWYNDFRKNIVNSHSYRGLVYLFADEFTNYNDVEAGISCVKLLHSLGYEVIIPAHVESGRTYLSKGMVRKAKKLANRNIELLGNLVNPNTPLLGIEPSAILSFRDEYPDLAISENRNAAMTLAENSLMVDEFIYREYLAGNISRDAFTEKSVKIKLHGHCHQKSIASVEATHKILEIPVNSKVEEIKSGCCGMAGSFGYEKEHYDVSMQVGELVLFPEIRKTEADFYIAAPGTSCRHQIKDGTGRTALHPIEILYQLLK